jgi:hypothetical protein
LSNGRTLNFSTKHIQGAIAERILALYHFATKPAHFEQAI